MSEGVEVALSVLMSDFVTLLSIYSLLFNKIILGKKYETLQDGE